MDGTLTPAVLWMLLGSLLSILADIIPGFNSWFDSRTKNVKRWVMLTLLLVVSGAIFGLNCWVVSAPYIVKYVQVACTEAGFLDLVVAFVYTIVGNQAAFLLLPKVTKRNLVPGETFTVDEWAGLPAERKQAILDFWYKENKSPPF